MSTFLLMRHGRTDWNEQARIQGQTDIGLADKGREQAREWGRFIARNHAPDRIISSHLCRAVETAEIVNDTLNLPLGKHPGLAEMDWGDWSGNTKEDMRCLGKALAEQEACGFGFRPPGGESRAELLQRAESTLMELAARHPDETLLIVTHNGVLRALTHKLLGLNYLPGEDNPLKPYRLHRLTGDGESLKLCTLNLDL